MLYNMGAGQTIPSGSAVFMWLYFWAPNALAIEANGGLQLLIGSATTAFRQWYLKGSDTLTYGGWLCAAVDPEVAASATTGSPTTTRQYFGAQANITGAVSKGQPLGIDAFRYGSTIQAVSGESGNYATFLGASAQNDSISNRWGLFQSIDGGYLMQGRFLLGTSATAVDFRDSNRNIAIANTKFVGSSFNRFEIQNASSIVQWTNITVSALGTTSKGNFIVTDNAQVTLTGCSFNNTGTFSLQSNTTISNCAFRSTGNITQSSSTIIGSEFIGCTIISDNPTLISNNAFTLSGTHHAIEITTPGTSTLAGNTFSNFGSNDSASAAVYNNSGGAITLNISGALAPTIRNGTGATTTINNTVTVTLTGLKDNTEVRIFDQAQNELAGTEDATAGTTNNRSFAFSLEAGLVVDIMIVSLSYENIRLEDYTIPASATSIPIQQIFDRNYIS